MNSKILTDSRIWITGANRGIGKAIAAKLAESGSELFLSSRTITKENYSELKNRNNISCIQCDVSSKDEVENAYRIINESGKGLDILINNAGAGYFNEFGNITDEQFEAMIDINIKGTYYCTKTILPDMIKAGSGMIINILSVAATTVFKGSSVYSASKAAILMMDRVLRNEVRQYGVKIIDILPGATDTDLWSHESRQEFSEKMMTPGDIADVVSNVIELNKNNRLLTEEIVIRPQSGDL